MDVLHQLLVQILLAIVIPVITVIGILLGKLIKKSISHIDNKLMQGLAWQAVLWVEQTFQNLHGKDKFDKAYEWLANKLPGVEEKDIERAIEAAVKEMNTQFPKVAGSPAS